MVLQEDEIRDFAEGRTPFGDEVWFADEVVLETLARGAEGLEGARLAALSARPAGGAVQHQDEVEALVEEQLPATAEEGAGDHLSAGPAGVRN